MKPPLLKIWRFTKNYSEYGYEFTESHRFGPACNTCRLSISSGKPNILILLADDTGYGDIGVYGSEIQTPNIDNLADEGIQFTNFHVGAACSPTRTMLMTGVDNHRAGLGNMMENYFLPI